VGALELGLLAAQGGDGTLAGLGGFALGALHLAAGLRRRALLLAPGAGDLPFQRAHGVAPGDLGRGAGLLDLAPGALELAPDRAALPVVLRRAVPPLEFALELAHALLEVLAVAGRALLDLALALLCVLLEGLARGLELALALLESGLGVGLEALELLFLLVARAGQLVQLRFERVGVALRALLELALETVALLLDGREPGLVALLRLLAEVREAVLEGDAPILGLGAGVLTLLFQGGAAVLDALAQLLDALPERLELVLERMPTTSSRKAAPRLPADVIVL
jgi:hypothetical protein